MPQFIDTVYLAYLDEMRAYHFIPDRWATFHAWQEYYIARRRA